MKCLPNSIYFGNVRVLRSLGLVVFSLLFVSGCVTAPHAQLDEANSLGRGNWRLEGGIQPGASFGAGSGITDNADIGVQVDFYGSTVFSGWGKYSFVNQTQGLSVALLGGMFVESNENYYGGFVGPILSFRTNNVLYSLRGRYNRLQGDSETYHFDSDNFYSHENIGQVDASVRFYLNNDRMALKVGAGCVFAIGDREVDKDDTTSSSEDKDYECSPTFGISFYL